jgi:monofunctional biosynthetic peptidoglycan transglycosylase
VARKSWFGRLLRLTVYLMLALLLGSAVLVVALRWLNPPVSAFMIEAQMQAWATRDKQFVLRHKWVALDRISPNLALAVVASEDQKFPAHFGFDVTAIEKAYALNQHSHQVRGASTISQQVAKNLFLWSGRSYFRKGLEAYFTLLTEAFWPKRRILEVYLNIAEFGPGLYGAEAASLQYFRHPAASLSRSEAASLAVVLPNPERISAVRSTAYVEQRRRWVLDQMQALGGPDMLGEIDAYPSRRR